MFPVPVLGKAEQGTAGLCPFGPAPQQQGPVCSWWGCGSGSVPARADGGIQILCPALTVIAVTALGPAPPLDTHLWHFVKVITGWQRSGEAQHPRRPQKVAFSCDVVFRMSLQMPHTPPSAPEPPLLLIWGKMSWDQHSTSISNGALCASASFPHTARIGKWWES